jgi:hypothetical protein
MGRREGEGEKSETGRRKKQRETNMKMKDSSVLAANADCVTHPFLRAFLPVTGRDNFQGIGFDGYFCTCARYGKKQKRIGRKKTIKGRIN